MGGVRGPILPLEHQHPGNGPGARPARAPGHGQHGHPAESLREGRTSPGPADGGGQRVLLQSPGPRDRAPPSRGPGRGPQGPSDPGGFFKLPLLGGPGPRGFARGRLRPRSLVPEVSRPLVHGPHDRRGTDRQERRRLVASRQKSRIGPAPHRSGHGRDGRRRGGGAERVAVTSKKTWAVLAFLLYAALQFFYLDKYPLPWGDEFFYTDPSWHFLSKGTFANTLYPPYVHYDVTNVVYGRVFLFINALIFFLFDYSLFTIRLQPLLMGFLALFLTFKVCDRMFGRTGAWIAAGLLSFSAMFIHGSHSGRPEMTVAVLTLLSLFLFQKGEEKSRYYFFAGLAATLAVDVHPPSGIVAPGGLCFLLAVRFAPDRARKKTWNWRMVLAAGSGMALGALWWLAVHVLIHPELYREQMELNKRVQVPMWDRSLLYIFKKEALRYYGFFWQGRYHRNMLFFCALILSLAWIARRRRPKDAEFLAYLAGAASALLTVAVNSFPYYLVAVYPLFCAAAGTALSDWAGSRGSFPRK